MYVHCFFLFLFTACMFILRFIWKKPHLLQSQVQRERLQTGSGFKEKIFWLYIKSDDVTFGAGGALRVRLAWRC